MSTAIRVAAVLAGGLSVFVLVACLVVVPSLVSEINSIRAELDADMAEFRVLSNDLWTDMMSMGGSAYARRYGRQAGYGSPPAPHPFAPAQRPLLPDSIGPPGQPQQENYGPQEPKPTHAPAPLEPPVMESLDITEAPLIPPAEEVTEPRTFPTPPPPPPPPAPPGCNCNPANTCPPGPPGVPGTDGEAGTDGPNGLDGQNGVDAPDVESGPQDLGVCYTCPPGKAGRSGVTGRTGTRGMRGSVGQAGQNGSPGRPGTSGDHGDVGAVGAAGNAGPKGAVGSDIANIAGLPGAKGVPGEVGPTGDQGPVGQDAQDGESGPQGPEGLVGDAGQEGQEGQQGFNGVEGLPGPDAQYCSCPGRDNYVHFRKA